MTDTFDVTSDLELEMATRQLIKQKSNQELIDKTRDQDQFEDFDMGALEPGTPGYTEQIFVNATIRRTSGNMRRHQEQVSKLMIFSLIVMIASFIMATPLSLILTIPAYILADRAEVLKNEKSDITSRRYRCYKYWSILLNLATIIVGFSIIVVVITVYIYIVYPKTYHG